jgi:hypothetical protein
MKTIRRLAIALVVLLSAAPASARGGRRRMEKPCVETSAVPVLGRASCYHFGAWDVSPRIVGGSNLGADFGVHILTLSHRSFDAIAYYHGTQTNFTVSASSLGLVRTYPATIRLAPELVRLGPIHFGPSVDLGGSSIDGARAIHVADREYTPSGFFYLAMGVLHGFAFRTGPVSFRGEVLSGFTYLRMDTQRVLLPPPKTPLVYPTRVSTGSRPPPADAVIAEESRFLLAPRVSTEVWIHPHFTAGVFASMDAVHHDDFAFGLTLRAYIIRNDDPI